MDISDKGSLSAKTLLLDQSNRIEQHRANFDALKEEYLKLQEMYDKLKGEHSDLSDSYSRMVTKSEEIIQQLQGERDAKTMENEHLRQQVLDPVKLKELQDSITSEMEDMYRQHIEALEMELHVLKSDHGKMKRNYEFLKSEFETVQSVHEAKLKELNSQHLSQITEYKQQCKELVSRLERDIPTEIQRVRQLQRDNTQLDERIKHLLTENKELRSQAEVIETQKGQEIMTLRQQKIQSESIIEQLTSEKVSLESHLKHMESDLEISGKEQQSLTKELHKLQRELHECQRQHDDLVHQHAKEKDEINMKNLVEVQRVQEEKLKFLHEIEQYKSLCETLEQSVNQLEISLANKAQQLATSAEEVKRAEWEKQMIADKEKGELEHQLTTAQSIFLSKTQEYDKTLSDLQDQLTTLEASKASLEDECKLLKKELEQKKNSLLKATKDTGELKEVKSLATTLTMEKASLEESNQHLEEELERERAQIQLLEHKLKTSQSEMRAKQDEYQQKIEKLKCNFEEAQTNWQQTQDDFVSKLSKNEEQLKLIKKKKDKLKKQHQKSLEEIQKLLDLTASNEKEALVEKERIKRAADEDKRTLRKQLQTMQKRHQQFVLLLSSTPETVHLALHHDDVMDISEPCSISERTNK